MRGSFSTVKPHDFQPTVEVAGCYCEWAGKILMLHRHPERPQGGLWALPAGKMEKGESAKETAIREIQEEVGFLLLADEIKEVGVLFCRLPHLDYIFHMFRYSFSSCPQVKLELKEHLAFQWVTVEEALQLPLISGGAEALAFYKRKP